GWQAKTMDVLVLREGCIVSMSTPYPPAPFRVRSGTVDIPHTTTSTYISIFFYKKHTEIKKPSDKLREPLKFTLFFFIR
ncbi:hypothetical protein COE78_11615, partial [Bacillus pseudomycoides]